MDEKKLWQKISGSITFYLKDSDVMKSNEELLEDYLEYVLPNDLEEDGIHRYLDKQTYNYVTLDDTLVEKAKKVFIERLESRRLKEPIIYEKNNLRTKCKVIDFSKYKK